MGERAALVAKGMLAAAGVKLTEADQAAVVAAAKAEQVGKPGR